MNINSIGNILTDSIKPQAQKSSSQGFDNIFTDLINNVNKDQMEAGKITKDFIAGEDIELHEVMIAGEKAKTSLDLLMEIRNKTLDMYKELTRMPV